MLLACDISQLQVERQTLHSVLRYAAAGLKCSACLSWLTDLGMWYTEAFHSPRMIQEIAEETDALILALKTGQYRHKVFGKSWCDAAAGGCFHPGWHSLKHQCLHGTWRCPESRWPWHNAYGACTMLSIHQPPPPTFGAYPVFILVLGFWGGQLGGDLWRIKKPNQWKTAIG